MPNKKLPPDFLKRLRAVTSKRPKTVITHILNHAHITTDELKTLYGYDHPPRAAQDVRDLGIPLETFYVISPGSGRKIAAYRFGDPAQDRIKLSGRKGFSKKFKAELVKKYGSRCGICLGEYDDLYLQIDHRVPYQVAGDAIGERVADEYMLVCGACNRAKSWSCEHCKNWLEIKSPDICRACYWAQPEAYEHVAMREIRRLDMEWAGDETVDYDKIKEQAESSGLLTPDYVKTLLKKLSD